MDDIKAWYMIENQLMWLHDDCALNYGEERAVTNPNLIPPDTDPDKKCQRCGDDYNTYMLMEHGNPAYW